MFMKKKIIIKILNYLGKYFSKNYDKNNCLKDIEYMRICF